MIALPVFKLASPLYAAGTRQEPPVSSQIEQVTRLAATDTPEPELDAACAAARSVSYGLQGLPAQVLRELPAPSTTASALAAPPGSPLAPLYSLKLALARMIAPLARSCATIVESAGAASMP